MKIIHIISGLGPGGAQVVLKEFLRLIIVIHTVISMMDKGIYGEKIQNLNVPIYELGFQKEK